MYGAKTIGMLNVVFICDEDSRLWLGLKFIVPSPRVIYCPLSLCHLPHVGNKHARPLPAPLAGSDI